MRLTVILPYVALLLVGQAALDGAPGIVAEREGGMGLGSALIVAQVVRMAGLMFGATLAAFVVDRRSPALALLAGALLHYAGLMATDVAPMGALAWIMVAFGVAGVGFGFMLTAAFSVAAAIAPGSRPLAVVLLLAATFAARPVVGVVHLASPMALLVAGAGVVGLSVLAVRMTDRASSPASRARVVLPAGRAVLAGVLLAAGTMLVLAGADSSRLTAALLAGTLGLGGLDTLDTVRAAMLVGAVFPMLGGAAALMMRTGVGRHVRLGVPALALAAVVAAGIASAMMAMVHRLPEDGAMAPDMASLAGGASGLVIGVWWLARGGRRRSVTMAGTLILVVVSVLGFMVLAGHRPVAGDARPILLIASAGVGIGLVTTALRLALAEAAAHHRGLAAGAGVVATTLGSVLGSMVGIGEGTWLVSGGPPAISAGAAILVAAAVAAFAIATLLPSSASSME